MDVRQPDKRRNTMGALGAAISGLQSSQKWLDVISNNVSNSNTIAYKSGRLTFGDLISEGLRSASGPDSSSNLGGINPNQVGLGVTVASVQTIMKQGALQTTGNVSDIAINGTGFLTVAKGSEQLYTRAGNLTFDQQGNLVTADGGLVQGWSMKSQVNPAAPGPMIQITSKLDTSNTSAIGNIQIPNNLVLAPKQTSAQTATSIKDQGVIIKGNLDNNTPQNAGALPLGGAFTAAQLAAFVPDATTNFTVYDSLGTAWNFTMLWQQTAVTPGAQASWQWNLFYTPNGAAPIDQGTGTFTNVPPDPGSWVCDSSGVGVGGGGDTSTAPITFNPDGSLAVNGDVTNNPPQNIVVTLPITNGAIGAGGVNGDLTFALNFGTPNVAAAPPIAAAYGLRDGLTGDYGNGSFNPVTGVYQPKQTVYTSFVDGYSEGTLTGMSFNSTGGIDASFSNGQVATVAQLAISRFANQDGLEKTGGNYFQQTANSGLAQIGTAGSAGYGTITGGAVEASNVDLTVELTNMILAQRMFESNARVVTAADHVLDTLVNLGR
jgi:flagellar hook protein FlgE